LLSDQWGIGAVERIMAINFAMRIAERVFVFEGVHGRFAAGSGRGRVWV
jgi:hypothetical protein